MQGARGWRSDFALLGLTETELCGTPSQEGKLFRTRADGDLAGIGVAPDGSLLLTRDTSHETTGVWVRLRAGHSCNSSPSGRPLYLLRRHSCERVCTLAAWTYPTAPQLVPEWCPI